MARKHTWWELWAICTTQSSLNKLSYHHYHPRDSNAEGSNKSFLEKVRVKESTTSVTKQDTLLTLTITFMMQCCITLPFCFLDWLLQYVQIRSVFFLKNHRKKIPHFFPAPQKLFLLIQLKNESLYEVKSLNKVINRNNFYGAGKKWGIFICEFLKKYGSYVYVYSLLWSTSLCGSAIEMMQERLYFMMKFINRIPAASNAYHLSKVLDWKVQCKILGKQHVENSQERMNYGFQAQTFTIFYALKLWTYSLNYLVHFCT